MVVLYVWLQSRGGITLLHNYIFLFKISQESILEGKSNIFLGLFPDCEDSGCSGLPYEYCSIYYASNQILPITMKKLLPLAAAALMMLLPASVEAKPRYKQLKIMTGGSWGYLQCGWDSLDPKDIKKYLANGWQFVSETPLQYQVRNAAGNNLIDCVGKSVVLVKHD